MEIQSAGCAGSNHLGNWLCHVDHRYATAEMLKMSASTHARLLRGSGVLLLLLGVVHLVLAFVFVRFDHVARVIINANHSLM